MSSENKPYFPLFMDLSEQKVIVVGAGTIAKRRIRTLIGFTNHLEVIAPEVNPELKDLEQEGRIVIHRKHYNQDDIQGAFLVVAAASDNRINRMVYEDCKKEGILVNVCNDKEKCDYYFPAIARKDHVVIAVSSSGKEPGRSRELVNEIREKLNE